MFIKLFSVLIASSLLMLYVGCESTDTNDSDYTFSSDAIVGSISEPVGGKAGDLAKIVTKDSEYVVMVTEGVNLQRLKTDSSGFQNISVEEYTIIMPGDKIQFAWTVDQIDYSVRPPVVRADTIIVLK